MATFGVIALVLLVVYVIGFLVMYSKLARDSRSQFIDLSGLDFFLALGWPFLAVSAFVTWWNS